MSNISIHEIVMTLKVDTNWVNKTLTEGAELEIQKQKQKQKTH